MFVCMFLVMYDWWFLTTMFYPQIVVNTCVINCMICKFDRGFNWIRNSFFFLKIIGRFENFLNVLFGFLFLLFDNEQKDQFRNLLLNGMTWDVQTSSLQCVLVSSLIRYEWLKFIYITTSVRIVFFFTFIYYLSLVLFIKFLKQILFEVHHNFMECFYVWCWILVRRTSQPVSPPTSPGYKQQEGIDQSYSYNQSYSDQSYQTFLLIRIFEDFFFLFSCWMSVRT